MNRLRKIKIKRIYLVLLVTIVFGIALVRTILLGGIGDSAQPGSNFQKYEGDGFEIYFPENFEVTDSSQTVQFLYKEFDENTLFNSLAVIPDISEQDDFKSAVLDKNCDSIKESVILGLFGTEVEGDLTAELKTLNGSRSCKFKFKNESNEVLVYTVLNNDDKLYIVLVGAQVGSNVDDFNNLVRSAMTFKFDENLKKDEYAYLSRRSADAKPKLLDENERVGKTSVMKTTKGTIEIELFGEEAPLAVSNHIELAKSGFYKNLTFHRREEGFVIQGGDPKGDGTGGPGYQFEDEPVKRNYERGILAMANSGTDTNGSQFFIMLADNDLPKNYTIFGKVTKGIEVVDKIRVGDKILEITIK